MVGALPGGSEITVKVGDYVKINPGVVAMKSCTVGKPYEVLEIAALGASSYNEYGSWFSQESRGAVDDWMFTKAIEKGKLEVLSEGSNA